LRRDITNKPVQNTAEIRSLNKKKIINHLRKNDPVTKKDLALKLNLSFATVSNICNEACGEDFITVFSSFNSSGGRIPGLLSINPGMKYMFGMNLSNKNLLEGAVLNLKNEIIFQKKTPVGPEESLESLLDKIEELFHFLLNENKIKKEDVLGLGISVPGSVAKINESIINSNMSILENIPLKKIIEERLAIRTYVENDSDLLVLSTSWFEKNRSKNRDIIYLYIGDGLGAGIICNGNLVKGNAGMGGEISHLPLGLHDFDCYCGSKGCIETELSVPGFIRKYSEYESNLPLTGSFSFSDFLEKFDAGNAAAVKTVEENGVLLGKLILILMNIFDPEIFYVGGIREQIFKKMKPFFSGELKGRTGAGRIDENKIFYNADYENLIFKGCGELVFNEWMP
jgi:predicted NBD/HSP70 family sugar kinase